MIKRSDFNHLIKIHMMYFLIAILMIGTLISHVALAEDARILSGPGQAWDDWASENRRARSESLGQQGQPNRERRLDAQGNNTTNSRISGMAGNVAKGLGLVTTAVTADEAGKKLDELSAELARRGMTRSQSAVNAARRALENAGLLDPADKSAEPQVPDGNPGVPSACEGNRSCAQCYGGAIENLDNTRWRLERLRAIYSSTYRYGKNMMAFADGASAVHGTSALAWQSRKIEVLKSLKNLDGAYDKKYAELISQLYTDLQGYSNCEGTVMRVPDWFDRFGFVYYQFMKTYYKKPSL